MHLIQLPRPFPGQYISNQKQFYSWRCLLLCCQSHHRVSLPCDGFAFTLSGPILEMRAIVPFLGFHFLYNFIYIEIILVHISSLINIWSLKLILICFMQYIVIFIKIHDYNDHSIGFIVNLISSPNQYHHIACYHKKKHSHRLQTSINVWRTLSIICLPLILLVAFEIKLYICVVKVDGWSLWRFQLNWPVRRDVKASRTSADGTISCWEQSRSTPRPVMLRNKSIAWTDIDWF